MGIHNAFIVHTFRVHDLFVNFPYSKAKIKRSDRDLCTKANRPREFVMSIFRKAVNIVLEEVIYEGTEFSIEETSNYKADICLYRIPTDKYIRGRLNGAYKDFDPIESNFSAYQVIFRKTVSHAVPYYSEVHINERHTKDLAKLSNTGKIKAGVVKTYEDIIPKLKEAFPSISTYSLAFITKFGFRALSRTIRHRGDVLITNQDFVFQTGIMFRDPLKMMTYMIKKLRSKIHIMYKKLACEWDGYYYFSISKKLYELLKSKLDNKEEIDFGKTLVYKCYDEAIVTTFGDRYILRTKLTEELKRFYEIIPLKVNNAEVIDKVHPLSLDTFTLKGRKFLTLFLHEPTLHNTFLKNKKILKQRILSNINKFKK